MKRHGKNLFFLLGFIFFLDYTYTQETKDTIRIATYNFLNYPGSNWQTRNPYFRRVLTYVNPDILVAQEVTSTTGVDTFRNQVLNYGTPHRFLSAPFHDGFDTDNALFYDSAKVSFIRASYIVTGTNTRDIAEYIVRIKSTSDTLRLYSLHIKANQGDSLIRLSECTTLRTYLNTLPSQTKFLILGDFNIYRSTEPGFLKLLANETNNIGRAKDPLNQVGNYHDNSTFRYYFTQSTRIRQFGGGATGGLDDWFDHILSSFSSLDSNLLVSSYTTYGNDGNHQNDSINQMPNTAVPDSIANALHYTSDHLPVAYRLQFRRIVSPTDSVTVSIPIRPQWNMISLPVLPRDPLTKSVFSNAVSSAFRYTKIGYQSEDTLRCGIGYWLKFATQDTVYITGIPRTTDIIPVNEGWNLIGTITTDVLASAVAMDPSYLTHSSFFGYQWTYVVEDTLRKGHGYWVKASGNGSLILSVNTSKKNFLWDAVLLDEIPPPPHNDSKNKEESSLSGFQLYQNYPNPFNQSTVIQIDAPQNTFVVLTIYNLWGEKVFQIRKQATTEQDMILLDGKNWPSGMYFYNLQIGSSSVTRKMILLK